METMIRALTQDGGARLVAVNSTAMVREMERIHQPSAVVAAALGRLLTGASMIGSLQKNERDSLTIRVNGGGPAGTLLVVADAAGNVRGYAEHPLADAPLREDGKLNVGAVVGREGTLAMVRDSGAGEPYVGTTPLVSGEIAQDITAYFAASEQTPGVCALGVLVGPDLSILAAGGFLLNLLPGCAEETIRRIEENVGALPAVTTLLAQNDDSMVLARQVLQGLPFAIVDERTTRYECKCSEEKTRDILLSLGKDELEQMKREDPVAEVVCHFCNRKYRFAIDEL